MNDLAFTDPDRKRYFEDYIPGKSYVLGSVTIDSDEMLAFAKLYDPQDIHIDAERANAGPFGGLIASGWFTGAKAMPIYTRHYLSNASSMASPGLENLKWNAPVRAGDILTVKVTIKGTKKSRSKPDRGVVKTFLEIINQDDVAVMTIDVINMIACEPG